MKKKQGPDRSINGLTRCRKAGATTTSWSGKTSEQVVKLAQLVAPCISKSISYQILVNRLKQSIQMPLTDVTCQGEERSGTWGIEA